MKVSYSLLRLYEQCPLAAKLIRIDRVEREKNYQKRFITGTAGHRFLQRWFRKGFDRRTKPWEAGVIVDIVAAQTGVEWSSQSERSQYKWRAIKEASLLTKAVRHHGIDKMTSLELEKHVSAPLPGMNHSIGGIADMVADEGGWVLDMKMSTDSRWAERDQLIFYGLLFQIARNLVPTRLSFFLPLNQMENQIVDVEFTSWDFEAMRGRMDDLVERWTQEDFPATSNLETCRRCEVWSHCKGNGKQMSSSLPGPQIATLGSENHCCHLPKSKSLSRAGLRKRLTYNTSRSSLAAGTLPFLFPDLE